MEESHPLALATGHFLRTAAGKAKRGTDARAVEHVPRLSGGCLKYRASHRALGHEWKSYLTKKPWKACHDPWQPPVVLFGDGSWHIFRCLALRLVRGYSIPSMAAGRG